MFASDGSGHGTAETLKYSLTKLANQYFPDDAKIDILRELKASVHDQKKTETNGIITAVNSTPSNEHKCVYKRAGIGDADKTFLDCFCGQHIINGAGEKYGESQNESFKALQDAAIITYQSRAVYVIRDIIKYVIKEKIVFKELNDLEAMEQRLYALTSKYEIWTDSNNTKKKKAEQTRLNELTQPIGIFDTYIPKKSHYEYHYHSSMTVVTSTNTINTTNTTNTINTTNICSSSNSNNSRKRSNAQMNQCEDYQPPDAKRRRLNDNYSIGSQSDIEEMPEPT